MAGLRPCGFYKFWSLHYKANIPYAVSWWCCGSQRIKSILVHCVKSIARYDVRHRRIRWLQANFEDGHFPHRRYSLFRIKFWSQAMHNGYRIKIDTWLEASNACCWELAWWSCSKRSKFCLLRFLLASFNLLYSALFNGDSAASSCKTWYSTSYACSSLLNEQSQACKGYQDKCNVHKINKKLNYNNSVVRPCYCTGKQDENLWSLYQ